MKTATDTAKVAPRDGARAPAGDEADEIRGMMPSFHGWHEAQHALAFERAAATRARDRDGDVSGTRRRWPFVLAAVAVVAVAVGLERGGGPDSAQLTATTPVEQLPWRNVDAPSGAFHVSLPDKPHVRSVVTAAGSGEQLELRLQQTTVAVAAFPVTGPAQGHELVRPLLDERAEALDGRVDSPRPVGSRAGAAFEGFIRTTTAVAVVRVIVDGTMLYVIELRGDVESPRTRQIYDRVVLSFTVGS
ncbi:MAG TPA: hypothetical protein VM282_03260 [Acidimicrobiales bacterium]|nr:hypothetical protein [Acidimicrobiales bacterium]